MIVIFMVNLFFFQVSYLLFFCYYNLVATGFQSKKKLKKFRRILTIEMWQLKFDHHLDNQFLFSSFMFLLFFATLKFDHRMYRVDWNGIMVSTKIGTRIQIHLDHGPCDDQIPIWEKSEKNKTKQNKIWSQKVDKCFFPKTSNWWQNIWF